MKREMASARRERAAVGGEEEMGCASCWRPGDCFEQWTQLKHHLERNGKSHWDTPSLQAAQAALTTANLNTPTSSQSAFARSQKFAARGLRGKLVTVSLEVRTPADVALVGTAMGGDKGRCERNCDSRAVEEGGGGNMTAKGKARVFDGDCKKKESKRGFDLYESFRFI